MVSGMLGAGSAWRRLVLLLLAVAALGTAADAETVEEFVRRHWRRPLAPQGPPPPRFTPLEASLHPEACGTCHPAQYADWRTSAHAASTGPGVAGQLVDMLEREPATALGCLSCHAPLAEQAPLVRDADGFRLNPAYDASLLRAGLVCAACHVRAHERFGPPRRDGAPGGREARHALPHNGVTRTPAFVRSEFCRSCHQFDADAPRLNGKPLEDTYEEWLASPFARQGVQCQDCHMPDRRHTWRGIHDPDMVRSGLEITVTGGEQRYRPGEVAVVTLTVRSVRVGHRFPTYVTPRVILRAEAIGPDGSTLAGSRVERVIARKVTLDLSREVFDTRLAPGEGAALVARRRLDGPGLAIRLSVVVEPDAFYTRFFQALLEEAPGRGAPRLRQALEATRRSPFTVFERLVPLELAAER